MEKDKTVRAELLIQGMPEEKVNIILEFDHQVYLGERYCEENRAYDIENDRKKAITHGGHKEDPIECLEDPQADVHNSAFPENRTLDPRIAKLLVAMESLSEEQVDLIYDLYGSGMSLEEIAKREGVTRQAVYGRRRTILMKLKRLMEE